MQQIADWLEKLGMPEYGECFAENKIDLSVLPHLTDQDLKDIGVPLGHRRKMLAAVAQLDDTSIAETSIPVPGSLKPQPPIASTSSPTPESAGERRHVTVMFSDLVGSTALSARMDPEDLREVISAYQKCVAETVRRFGGFVAKYLGDGVLVYFGYPQAHEDDAERAVRGAGVGCRGRRSEDSRDSAGARWHCNGTSGGWRPHRLRRRAGARHCGRDAEPRGAFAGPCRAEHRGHCRKHPQAPRQSL